MDFTTYEDDVAPPKRRNPLVMVGAVATAGVLCAGLVAFKRVRRVLPCWQRAAVCAQSRVRANKKVDGLDVQLADYHLCAGQLAAITADDACARGIPGTLRPVLRSAQCVQAPVSCADGVCSGCSLRQSRLWRARAGITPGRRPRPGG